MNVWRPYSQGCKICTNLEEKIKFFQLHTIYFDYCIVNNQELPPPSYFYFYFLNLYLMVEIYLLGIRLEYENNISWL